MQPWDGPDDLFEPLELAITRGDLKTLETHFDEWRQRIAPEAIESHNLECLLRGAVRSNQVASAAYLLDQGAPIEGITIGCGFHGEPPLDVYELFMERGWDINEFMVSSWGTLLIYAAVKNKIDMVRWCFAHGSDPNVRERHGFTALDWAANSALPDMIRLLVRHGGDLTRSNALHAAVGIDPEEDESEGARRFETIDCLLDEFGMDIDAVSDLINGLRLRALPGTPLHYAILAENPSTVAYLLHRGANIQARNIAGLTVWEYAQEGATPAEIRKLVALPN